MTEWSVIRYTEARQVAALVGCDEDDLPDPAIKVREHYGTIREAGTLADAVNFIGHALPRLEAIAWAADILDRESRTRTLKQRDRLALDYALRWLGDPNDANRRACYDAALNASDRAPERLLCFAVFFSGGSISLPQLEPVLPPPESANRFASAAVALAAYRTDSADVLMRAALERAESVAAQGIGALSAA